MEADASPAQVIAMETTSALFDSRVLSLAFPISYTSKTFAARVGPTLGPRGGVLSGSSTPQTNNSSAATLWTGPASDSIPRQSDEDCSPKCTNLVRIRSTAASAAREIVPAIFRISRKRASRVKCGAYASLPGAQGP